MNVRSFLHAGLIVFCATVLMIAGTNTMAEAPREDGGDEPSRAKEYTPTEEEVLEEQRAEARPDGERPKAATTASEDAQHQPIPTLRSPLQITEEPHAEPLPAPEEESARDESPAPTKPPLAQDPASDPDARSDEGSPDGAAFEVRSSRVGPRSRFHAEGRFKAKGGTIDAWFKLKIDNADSRTRFSATTSPAERERDLDDANRFPQPSPPPMPPATAVSPRFQPRDLFMQTPSVVPIRPWSQYDVGRQPGVADGAFSDIAQSYTFPQAARFPQMHMLAHGALVEETEAVIHEGMQFAVDGEGRYVVRMVVTAPAKPMTAHLFLVLRDSKGVDQTLTFPPIQIPPTSDSIGESGSWVVQHSGWLPEPAARHKIVRVFRGGTARFGFGVDVP